MRRIRVKFSTSLPQIFLGFTNKSLVPIFVTRQSLVQMASNKNQPIILLHAGTTSTSIGSGTDPNDPVRSLLKIPGSFVVHVSERTLTFTHKIPLRFF